MPNRLIGMPPEMRNPVDRGVADALDALCIPWEYLTSPDADEPDFVLTSHGRHPTYVMGGRRVTEALKERAASDNARILASDGLHLRDPDGTQHDAMYARCLACGRHGVYPAEGTWACPCCGEYDGDHHLADAEFSMSLIRYAEEYR